jgi:hypothetical protein
MTTHRLPSRKMKAPKVDGHIQMHEGTWYKLDSPDVTECCDCGLVHHTVDRIATRAARKRAGVRVVKA